MEGYLHMYIEIIRVWSLVDGLKVQEIVKWSGLKSQRPLCIVHP